MIGTIIAKLSAPKGFDALNHRDLDTYIQRYAEDATLTYPGDVPGVSGTHTGKKAIYAWYQKFFEQFPIFHITLEHVAISNLFDMVGNNTVVSNWTINMTNREGISGQSRGVTIATVHHGKVINCEEFLSATSEGLRLAWKA